MPILVRPSLTKVLGRQIATQQVVGIDRAVAGHLHVDQHHRLAGCAQGSEQLRLEEAGAEHGVAGVHAQLLGNAFGRADDDERQRNALAAAGLFGSAQHRRVERADGAGVVLAVQQEGDALDLFAPQLAEVVAQVLRDPDHRVAGRLRESGLVLQCARDRRDRQSRGLGDVANRHRFQVASATARVLFRSLSHELKIKQIFSEDCEKV
jgi:hypothetical protein